MASRPLIGNDVQKQSAEVGSDVAPGTPIAVSQGEFIEKFGCADVEDGVVVPTGLVTKGAGKPALAEAGLAGDSQVFMGLDPVTFHKACE